MAKKPCEKCGGTVRYEAGTGACAPYVRPVPCPYCKGLKVFSTSDFRWGEQVHIVAAVKSRAALARATGLSLHYLTEYSTVTGNAEQIEAAMSKPGTVFWSPLNSHETYREKDW